MPLVRLVFPMTAGIIIYLIGKNRLPDHAFVFVYLLTCSWMWFLLSDKRSNYSARWIPGLPVMLVFFTLGFHLAHSNDEIFHQRHFSRHRGQNGVLMLRLTEPVAEKANSFQVTGRVTHFSGTDGTKHTRGRLMLYLEKDSLARSLRYGDILVVGNRYESVAPPMNPKQFNYSRFLSFRNIHHSSYRRMGEWGYAGINSGLKLISAAISLRGYALNIFSRHLPQGREFALISALLLGLREYLDEDLQREFAGAGAIHILCVSGLHVGVIYLVLRLLTAFLLRFKWGVALQAIFIMLIIWLYAAVTGFSPSVLRASAMFSFVTIGQSFRYRTNIYNTLAASAILLMVINPFIVTRIGFQLSYMAVTGIVAIQPHLFKMISPGNKIAEKAWGILTVSLAAQLATGPLAIYYFNQFPNYFLLTNLAVIPLSGLIIYSGLLTLVLSSIPFAGNIAGNILYLLLMALHNIVRWIESLPLSTSQHIFLTLSETMLIYAIILFGCACFIGKWRKALLWGLLLLTCLSFKLAARNIYQRYQQHFIVYHVNRASIIDFIHGNKRLTITNSGISDNQATIDYNVAGYRISRGVINHHAEEVPESAGFFRLGNQTIMMITGHPAEKHGFDHFDPLPESYPEIRPDYLIISKDPVVDPSIILQMYHPGTVIVDSSNRFRTISIWKEACESIDIEFWSVGTAGAYTGDCGLFCHPFNSLRIAAAARLLAPPPPSFVRSSR